LQKATARSSRTRQSSDSVSCVLLQAECEIEHAHNASIVPKSRLTCRPRAALAAGVLRRRWRAAMKPRACRSSLDKVLERVLHEMGPTEKDSMKKPLAELLASK